LSVDAKIWVDVYHSGEQDWVVAPFLFVPPSERVLPPHPRRPKDWVFWKTVPLNTIAVQAAAARWQLVQVGFYIQ
jgi:hypothetical protein